MLFEIIEKHWLIILLAYSLVLIDWYGFPVPIYRIYIPIKGELWYFETWAYINIFGSGNDSYFPEVLEWLQWPHLNP